MDTFARKATLQQMEQILSLFCHTLFRWGLVYREANDKSQKLSPFTNIAEKLPNVCFPLVNSQSSHLHLCWLHKSTIKLSHKLKAALLHKKSLPYLELGSLPSIFLNVPKHSPTVNCNKTEHLPVFEKNKTKQNMTV